MKKKKNWKTFPDVPTYTLNKSKYLTFHTGVYHKASWTKEPAHKTC